jgi:hypothetical protein
MMSALRQDSLLGEGTYSNDSIPKDIVLELREIV